MRILFCAVFAFACLLAGEATAYDLLCRHDLPGASLPGATNERQYDHVRVDGADTLPEACQGVRDDPQFGDYNWRTCIDPSGHGQCKDQSF